MKQNERILLVSLALIFIPWFAGAGQRLDKLEIFKEEYPRAGYFRVAEFAIRRFYNSDEGGYRPWSRRMAELSGIMGKTESFCTTTRMNRFTHGLSASRRSIPRNLWLCT